MMVLFKVCGRPRKHICLPPFLMRTSHFPWTDDALASSEASDIKDIVPKPSRDREIWLGHSGLQVSPLRVTTCSPAVLDLCPPSSHIFFTLEPYFISYSWFSSPRCPVAGSFHIYCKFRRRGLKGSGFHVCPSQKGTGSRLKRRVSSGSVAGRDNNGQHPERWWWATPWDGAGFLSPFLKPSTAYHKASSLPTEVHAH